MSMTTAHEKRTCLALAAIVRTRINQMAVGSMNPHYDMLGDLLSIAEIGVSPQGFNAYDYMYWAYGPDQARVWFGDNQQRRNMSV